MIDSYKEYKFYLKEDKKSLGINDFFEMFRPGDISDIFIFQFYMRTLEYLVNCKKNRILILFFRYLYFKKGRQLEFSIPINVFGSGLAIVHKGTIVVSGDSKIGNNCRLHVCVNIGKNPRGNNKAPIIGSGCYIGPGAKIYGDIEVGSNVMIGANSVVNKSFTENNIVIAGVPAEIISKIK